MQNATEYAGKSLPVKQIWAMREMIKPCKEVLPGYLEMIQDQSLYPVEDFLAILREHKVTSDHIAALSHVLYGMLLREGHYPLLTKRKRLILRGEPNSGKTRMIDALIKFFHPSVFYPVGSRKNDFRGYSPADKPLII